MINLSRPRLALAAASAALLITTACGGSSAAPAGGTSSASGGAAGGITVLAAASLTGSFTELGKSFEAAHAGQKVTFSFGSSATLATQITQGAPADVFAAASPATMKTVTDAGAANTAVNFVSNTLEIAVPKGNPAHVKGLADFADESKKIALCAPEVPCGAAAEKVFAAAKITPKPDTYEADVKATLAKVTNDEVDAALVYKTDVIAAGDGVEGINFPESAQAVNEYPIATLKESKNAESAQAFVDYVLSPDGQAVLSKAGFAKP